MDLEGGCGYGAFSKTNINVQPFQSRFQEVVNKYSVNTNIEEEITQVINNPINSKNIVSNPLSSNIKTKPITKNKQKQSNNIMKHQKILQTLRNITKNLKSQINTQKPFDNKQNVQKLLVKKMNQQPEINQVQKIDQKEKMLNEKAQCVDLQRDIQPTLQKSKGEVVQQPKTILTPQKIIADNNKSQQQHQEPMINKHQISQQKILLYSKYKNCIQSYPLYEEKILTDKKQLRQITVQRQMDNDIESEDEQIQMGVGYLYYELVSSCKKNNSIIKMASLMKSRSKVKQKNHDFKMQSVRQKLVFN